MTESTKLHPEDALDRELRQQLEVIRNEETPERLLLLARTLQDLLRQRNMPN